MLNALTIDLEDYYQVTAFADQSRAKEWQSHESHVEKNTDKVLGILAASNCSATFFSLGWVAENYPKLIRRIAEAGHEIACHSNQHRLVYSMTPEEFREDTRKAKEILEDAGGVPVLGYRAPSFSITRDSQWAFEILAQLGFTYDSSIFPVKHLNYGIPNAPRIPFRVKHVTARSSSFRCQRLHWAMHDLHSVAVHICASYPIVSRAGASVTSTTRNTGRSVFTCTPGNSIPSSPAWSAASRPGPDIISD